jgi:hypothetical protein
MRLIGRRMDERRLYRRILRRRMRQLVRL